MQTTTLSLRVVTETRDIPHITPLLRGDNVFSTVKNSFLAVFSQYAK